MLANDGGLEARGSNQTQTKRIRPEWSPPARISGPLNGASDIDPLLLEATGRRERDAERLAQNKTDVW